MSLKVHYHHHHKSIVALPIVLVFSVVMATSLLPSAQAHAHCSLEGMKKFAMEACEHLFADEAVRSRRSVHQNFISDNDYVKTDHNSRLVVRASFPRGGYLRVDHRHYHKLSSLDVHPRYKASKRHFIDAAYYEHLNGGSGSGSGDSNGNSGNRFKREHKNRYRNLSYCCHYQCQDDFLC